MTLVREIRLLNNQPYYCLIDYSKNKYGDIVQVTRRIVARFNREIPATINSDGRILNKTDEKPQIEEKQTKPEEKPKQIENHDDVEETSVDENKEIENKETNNEVKEEDTMELNEENIMKKFEERQDARKRQELSELKAKQFEEQLSETREKLNGIGNVLDTKLGGFVDTVSTKLGGIESKIATQKMSDAAAEEAVKKLKLYEMTHKKVIEEAEIDCPTCKKDEHGHSHKLKKTSEGSFKCDGPNCGEEFLLAPKNSDSYCSTCGFPLNSKGAYPHGCPSCNNEDAKWRDKNKNK